MSEILPGKYLVIEGIDGAGKTSQKEIFMDRLLALGRPAVDIKDPDGTPLGIELKRILLNKNIVMDTETQMDLFTASRRELFRQVVIPSIEAGKNAVADRSWLSAVAYQGFGDGLDIYSIIERNKRVTGDYFMPSGVVILDVPYEVALERKRLTNAPSDRFENRGKAYYEKVQEGYYRSAEYYGIEIIDGTQSIEQVSNDVWGTLGNLAIGG